MAYRNILVESPAKLCVKNNQLCIENDTLSTISPEDVDVLLLQNKASTITAAALNLCAQNAIALFVCDDKHLPSGVLLPYLQHSRQTQVLQKQLAYTQPFKNRLWQQIVIAKINNQARCLHLCNKEEGCSYLQSRTKAVQSGDKDNAEATAAAYYFKTLFGAGFTRADDNGVNAALNYGYAILRGAMARTLCVYGYLPVFGLHHDSTLNAMNLADDCMEPFRPVVDLFVATNVRAEAGLTPELKRYLVNLLNYDVLSGAQHHSVSYAMHRMVQSLGRAENSKQPLLLPELLPLAPHRYE